MAAVFEEIYDSNSFRIEPIDKHGGDDDKSMAANNTSAFNCRALQGSTANTYVIEITRSSRFE